MTNKNCKLNPFIVSCLVLLLGAGPVSVGSAKNNRVKGTVLVTRPGHSPTGQSTTLLPDGTWLLLGGMGEDGQASNQAVLRNPLTGGLTLLPAELRFARAGHTATVLPDGNVLVLGGVGTDGKVVISSELFHPRTESFEPIASAPAPRALHTATLLTDGELLIAGGMDASGQPLKAVEVWDFRKHLSHAALPGLTSFRRNHAGTLLADGRILFSGGQDEGGKNLKPSEVYDPQANRISTLEDIQSLLQAGGLTEVRATLPEDGATGVPLDALLSLRFSRAVSMSSINAQTLVVEGPDGPVEAGIVAAEGGMLAFITPRSALAPGTVYTVSLSGALDTNNTNVAFAQFSFTTAGQHALGEPPLPPPSPLSAPEEKKDKPSVNWRALPPLQAPPGVTALAGQVLKLDGEPLPLVTLQIDSRSVASDETGRFLLTGITPGRHALMILGPTANTKTHKYGVFEPAVDIKPGLTNVLNYTIWMTPLDMEHAVTIPSPTRAKTIIRNPLLPGLELHLPANTVITDHAGKVVREISITAIPLDRPPFPLPSVQVPIYFTIQPGSAYIKVLNKTGPRGARLFYPNSFHRPPGTIFNFWNYDPNTRGWFIYGNGKVSADASQVIPDPGVELYEFTGAMVAGPNNAPPDGPRPGGSHNGPGTNNDNPGSSPNDGSGDGSSGSGSSDGGDSGPAKGKDGDPVDLSTGLFVYSHTDLYLPDVIPIVLTRIYRPNDPLSHAFGIGTSHPYDIFLVGDTSAYSFTDLVLADGGRVHYPRTSAGTSFGNAVYGSTTTPTSYFGSVINWNGTGWSLAKKNGSVISFPESFGATVGSQAAATSVTDRNGNTISMARTGPMSNISQITSPNNRWIQFTYDNGNRVTQAQDNIGRTVKYAYDAAGRLQQVTDVNGGVTKYTYDSGNNMTSITDARNIVIVQNVFDSLGRVITQTLADGSAWFYDYTVDSSGNITQTTVTYPNGSQRVVTFSSAGYMTGETLASGLPEQQTIIYNRAPLTNLLVNRVDALSRQTTYTYDALGNTTSTTVLDGTQSAATSSATYDTTYSRPLTITDTLGRTTQMQYDPFGNLTAVTDPLQRQATSSYNAIGQRTSSTDFSGNTVSLGFSGADLTSRTDALGNTTGGFRDAAGRIISVTNALGQTWRYKYDAADQILEELDPQGNTTSFIYDPVGNLLSVTDARHNTTSYTYDSMNRRITQTDSLQRLTSYEYDAVSGTVRIISPRGDSTTVNLDSLYRKISVAWGAESTITYSYDAGNRLTRVVDSLSGSISPQYDDFNRLISVTTPQGSTSYTFDTRGRRTSMLVAGQPAVSYGYDGADRLVQITQGSTSVGFVYDPNNHRTGLTLPNGVNVQYAFDQASRLTGTSYQLGTSTLGSLNYTYDSANRRMQTSGSFARTSLPQPVTSAVYDAANGLTQWNGTSLTYDAGGNMTSDGVTTYTWNMRNQVTSAGSASFQYDAFGRRVQNGRGIQFLYDGYNIVQEIMGTTPTANLLTGKTDEVFQRTDGSGTVTPLSEGAGTTVAMLDSTGAVRTQYTYDPYGRTTATGAATTNTVQYAGRENDGNDLYYYRARYYSTSLQRFINQDPAELTGGINRYTYALGGPTWLSDPSGADVTVVSYGGHAALAVGTDWPPIGFGPRDDQGGEFAAGVGILFGPYDPGVPGIVYPSDPNRPIQNWITIPTSPDQDTAIKNFMNRIHDNPPSYHVVGQSCVDFVEHALAAGGVAAPTNDLTPWGLVDDLQKMYPPPPSPADIDMGFTPVPPG